MGVGILAKRVVLELGLQHHLCLQSDSRLKGLEFFSGFISAPGQNPAPAVPAAPGGWSHLSHNRTGARC